MWPIEFAIHQIPPSQHSRSSKRATQWQKDLKTAASVQLGTSQPATLKFALAITFFFKLLPRGRHMPDIDNITKSVLDSLEGLVYKDDKSVTDVLCRRRDLNANLQISNPSSYLIRSLAVSGNFLHVIVDDAPIKGVHL